MLKYDAPRSEYITLARRYSKLKIGEFEIVGPVNPYSNCLSLVTGDVLIWREVAGSNESTFEYLKKKGWRHCEDGRFEESHIRIAIYADLLGRCSHFVLQTKECKWLSKLGKDQTILCDRVDALEGMTFGMVAWYMKRPREKYDP